MDIFKLITDQLNNQDTLNKLGQSVGADASQVQKLTELGMPVLLKALGRNSSTPEGASALANALDQHKDDNIEDISGFLNNINTDDGSKMLNHIFSDKNDIVQNNLAQKTGLEKNQVSGIMTQLAPLLLGALGQQKKQQNIDTSGIAGLLNGFLGQGINSGFMSKAVNMLDADNDGNIVDDVGNLLGRFLKK